MADAARDPEDGRPPLGCRLLGHRWAFAAEDRDVVRAQRAVATRKAFIAWFGPKGVASMLFALFVLESQAPDRTLVFELAALAILASILAHGLTDAVGARWVERRLERAAGGRSG